jgi:hypothetical protein
MTSFLLQTWIFKNKRPIAAIADDDEEAEMKNREELLKRYSLENDDSDSEDSAVEW